MDQKLKKLIDKSLSRRSFLTGAGTVAAGAVVAGCGSAGNPTPAQPTTPTTPTYTDNDILNFALNLEYLEAEFFLRATIGTGLSAADSGNATSKTTGGQQVPALTGFLQQFAYEMAQTELQHVRFLRSVLGSAAVAAPAIDLTNSFNTIASAAGIGSSFNPFANAANFLIGAFVFEDVGVTAYHGSAKLIGDKKVNFPAATEIMAVEAYHAAAIRAQIVASGSAQIQMANAISVLRGNLGGGNETSLSATTIVASDSVNSIAFGRTTDQVLHIVYGQGGGAGIKSGGFFPSGLNGTINTTTA